MNYIYYCSSLLLLLVAQLSCTTKEIDQLILIQNWESQLANQGNENSVGFEVINNNQALVIHSGGEIGQHSVVVTESSNYPWNLAGYYLVKAEVSNLGTKPVQAEMFVGNDPDGLVRWYCSDYVDLLPGQTKTIEVPLAWTSWITKPQLDIVGMRGAPGQYKTDVNKINSISFRSRYATTPDAFAVHKIWAEGRTEVRDTTDYFPMVDDFGQFENRDWPSKTHDQNELAKAGFDEKEDWQNQPKNLNDFGGWTAGPKLEATGYFKTAKHDDKWWLVDPEGYLFWSNGLNCVNSKMIITGTEGREHYFASLPNRDSDLGRFYTEGRWASHGYYKDKIPFEAYSFYEANLFRKYGQQWADSFRTATHKRFRSWGMNTFGNVSDDTLCLDQKTPYVGTVWINGTPKIEGSEGFWGKFHDVFDPEFRAAVRVSMEQQQRGADDPWCIGFFVDNEMSWGQIGSLSVGTLKSPANQPAKIEMISDLKNKYISIEDLNESWSTNYPSWEGLTQSTTLPDINLAKKDMADFYIKIAETYFKIVSEELDRIAPNQLYLGCRFAWSNNEPTLRAAAKYCDVVSFNKYEYSIANLQLPEGVDKPILIGEYHFGATDRGHTHPGVKVAASQIERGEMYQSYIEGALRNAQIVGAHWFQYTDQAMTGRQDGENYNVGFIDICDRPYPELIEAVRQTNYGMYDLRFGE
ncbi:hypothetical protein [Reichenbachiella sp.]|uniref:hypothetical protein n=1 Tax=Reichenbachiella sp. TaxID=2184521 RepID=UPI003BB0FDB4